MKCIALIVLVCAASLNAEPAFGLLGGAGGLGNLAGGVLDTGLGLVGGLANGLAGGVVGGLQGALGGLQGGLGLGGNRYRQAASDGSNQGGRI